MGMRGEGFDPIIMHMKHVTKRVINISNLDLDGGFDQCLHVLYLTLALLYYLILLMNILICLF